MPYLNLIVNFTVPDEKAFSLAFAKAGGEILGKPEKYMSTSVTTNPSLNFGGSHDKAFQLHITTLGNLSVEKNKEYSKKLSEFLEKELGIKSDRGYITFYDPGNAYLGFGGQTFDGLL
ncbi:Tautomerase/MIF [Atractiella rhizophila]|nr:Tautomerase/MIF [Atractiella rhizophila]